MTIRSVSNRETSTKVVSRSQLVQMLSNAQLFISVMFTEHHDSIYHITILSLTTVSMRRPLGSSLKDAFAEKHYHDTGTDDVVFHHDNKVVRKTLPT